VEPGSSGRNIIREKELAVEKRKFAYVCCVIFVVLMTVTRASAQARVFHDGCATLVDIVRQSLLSTMVVDDIRTEDNFGLDYGGSQLCGNTTAAIISAFRSSLNELNSVMRPIRVIACTGYDLHACDPFPAAFARSLQPEDLAVIRNRWQLVRNTVITQMPRGVTSDLSYFNPRELATRLRAATANPMQIDIGSIGHPD
jgi:hypothetical protein